MARLSDHHESMFLIAWGNELTSEGLRLKLLWSKRNGLQTKMVGPETIGTIVSGAEKISLDCNAWMRSVGSVTRKPYSYFAERQRKNSLKIAGSTSVATGQ